MNRALEGLLVGEALSREESLELGRTYGASEASLGRVIGQQLGSIAQTLSSEQRRALQDIRAAHISGQGHQITQQRLKPKLPKEDRLELRSALSMDQLSELLAMRRKYTGRGQGSLPENSLERGRQLFAQCAPCHDSSDQQAVAPHLDGIVGRRIADVAAFDGYSNAMRAFSEVEGVCSESALKEFL